MRIPARIIQTGKTRDLGPAAKAAATSLRLLHPGWEYLFFDDEDIHRFIAKEFPQHRGTFESFRYPIQRIDFFRYLAVFRLGGFYFDMDVFLHESLSPLLDCRCVFPFEELTISRHLRKQCGIDWEIGNYGFGAAAGHPFLEAVIENCVKAQREPAWLDPMLAGIPRLFRSEFEVLNSTGPGLLTRTLAENPQASGDMTVLFPDDVSDPNSWHQFGNYGVHLMDGSWRSRESYLRRRLANAWETWTANRALRESRRSGKTRSLAVASPAPGVSAGVAAMSR